jgi:TolA-binding protein
MAQTTHQKTKGKLSKKEMKQDKLVRLTYEVEHFYFQHQKWVMSVAVGIIVVVVAALLINRATKASRLEDSYQLTMAKLQIDADQLPQARDALSRLVSSAGSKVAGEAKFLTGRIAFQQGNYSEAADLFSAYLKEFSVDAELDCAAMMGLAACYHAMGKLEEAAQAYADAAKAHPKESCASQALWEASRIYLDLNQRDKASATLATIRDSYRESAVAPQASRELDALTFAAP